jgi:hypothetical protein
MTDGAEEEEEDREEEAGCAEGEAKDLEEKVALTLLREKRTARRLAGPFRFWGVPICR